MTPTSLDWVYAIALRIADEWPTNDSEDRERLFAALLEAFIKAPEAGLKLVGTQIIEEGYFDNLD